MLGIPQVARVRYHDRGNGPQPANDCSCLVEPTHMGVASGEKTIRLWEAWILLDREEQIRHRLFEASAEETRFAHLKDRVGDADARTEAQRSLEMLDRDIGLACPISECAAKGPTHERISG